MIAFSSEGPTQRSPTTPPAFFLWPHISSLLFVEDLFQNPNSIGLHCCFCNRCKTHWWPWVLFNGLLSGWTCSANESWWLYTRLFRALNASSCSITTFQPVDGKDERQHQLSQKRTFSVNGSQSLSSPWELTQYYHVLLLEKRLQKSICPKHYTISTCTIN